MQKLKCRILDRMMESKCTGTEIDFVLHISHYLDDSGTIEGVYYKTVCEKLKISHTTFYDIKDSLVEKNIIKVNKEDYSDWNIQILDNDFRGVDYENLSDKDKYINTSDSMFFSEEFLNLKANEKILAMQFLIISKSGRGCYNIGVRKFYDKYTKLFGVTKRAIQNYMTSLKKFFSIGVKRFEYWITPLAKVYKKNGAPSDATIYNKHIGVTICRREKVQYDERTLKDTVDLIKQYGTILKEKTIDVLWTAVKKSIVKANERIENEKKWIRKLQPKLVHKILKDEIEALCI